MFYGLKKSIVLFAVMSSLVACNTNSEKNDDSGDKSVYFEQQSVSISLDTLPEQILTQSVQWGACQDGLEPIAECADITVPMNWLQPEQATLSIHLKRLRAVETATRQLYLLNGGPGESSTIGMHDALEYIRDALPNTDIIAIDHRGSGYSGFLALPDDFAQVSEGESQKKAQMKRVADAMQQGYPNLAFFNTSYAAADVGLIVKLLSQQDVAPFVYGVSYGTYWAHRYAQLFPYQSKGIILDSIAASQGFSFTRWDAQHDAITQQLFQLCQQDSYCSQQFSGDALSNGLAIIAQFRQGHCDVVSDEQLTDIFDFLIDSHDTMGMLPALVYRLGRCSEMDRQVLRTLSDVVELMEAEQHPYENSMGLFMNIALNELWDSQIDASNYYLIDEQRKEGFFDFSIEDFAYLRQYWHHYARDQYFQQWASTDVPMLMMNGNLDPRTLTSSASIVKQHLNGAQQYFIEIPLANHAVIVESPQLQVAGEDSLSCGMLMMQSFIQDPTSKPDTHCVNDVDPINFQTNTLYDLIMEGEDLNIWGNESQP